MDTPSNISRLPLAPAPIDPDRELVNFRAMLETSNDNELQRDRDPTPDELRAIERRLAHFFLSLAAVAGCLWLVLKLAGWLP